MARTESLRDQTQQTAFTYNGVESVVIITILNRSIERIDWVDGTMGSSFPAMEPASFTSSERAAQIRQQLRAGLKTSAHGNPNADSAPWRFWIKAAIWLALGIRLYVGMIRSDIQDTSTWLLSVGYGIATAMWVLNFGHDASHGCVTRQPWLDRLVQRIAFVPIGVDSALWRMRHLRSHHNFTNVDDADIDSTPNPFLRLAPHMPWRAHHRVQHLYAPLVYAGVSLYSALVRDWSFLWGRTTEWLRRGMSPSMLTAGFFLNKLLWLTVTIVVPLFVMKLSAVQAVALFFTISASQSAVLIFLLVGTHFVEEVQHWQPAEDRRLDHSWVEHQFMTSCDWNADSAWAEFVCGGANMHLAHHVFPAICHAHLRGVQPALRRVARENGLPLHQTSLWGMLRSHFRHLRNMGRRPAAG